MIEALVAMNAESGGMLGTFISVGIFFVLLVVLSFVDNMETFLSACILTAIITLFLWFNAIVYFPVLLCWVVMTMLVGAYKIFNG